MEFFLEWDIFHMKVVEKITEHVLCVNNFFLKSRHLWEYVGKKM